MHNSPVLDYEPQGVTLVMIGLGGSAPDDLERELESTRNAGKANGDPVLNYRPAVEYERDLLNLFVRNQLKVALALPLVALLFAVASLSWTNSINAGAWLACVLGCQCLQLYLCRVYESSVPGKSKVGEWVGMLAASEFFYASCWSVPLYSFWVAGNDLQHMFVVAMLMTVVAVRIMIACNFMPIVIAGTGFITFNIVIRCITEATPLYVGLGTIVVLAEVFFIQLAKRLQATARDMLIFKAQREQLISELSQARDQADAARRKAEAANSAKSRFLATMSHELRTPLNAIMGFSEILSHELMGPHSVKAYKDYSSDIHYSGNYLLNLINDILDLSRIEAGRRELREEPIDVVAEARYSLSLIEFKVREKKHRIIENFQPDLPRVLADHRAVRQMWLNLISNAVKFTPAGGEITLATIRKTDGSLSIVVSDNGPGIQPKERKAALDMFSRGASASRQAIDGAGLGLPIVNGLANLHSAELCIRSGNSGGAYVSVTFPTNRVIDTARAEVLHSQNAASESQRRLIALTA